MSKFRSFYLKELFVPSFIGIFINPLFFIRNGLKKGIIRNKKYLYGRLLDFGCGTKPYRTLFEVQEYIGLEKESADDNPGNLSADFFYDGNTIPFPDNHFDSILSSEVFEHIFNLEQVLKELYRVLKPGGFMLVTTPFVWDEHSIPFDYGRYTSFGIIYLLEKNEFEIITSEKSSNYVQTIFQMWNAYIYQHLFPSNKFIKALLVPLFIAPVTILGIIIAAILPKNKNFYHNNVVVVRK